MKSEKFYSKTSLKKLPYVLKPIASILPEFLTASNVVRAVLRIT